LRRSEHDPIKIRELVNMCDVLTCTLSGIDTATVAINGLKNAGILTTKILTLSDPVLGKKLSEYCIDLYNNVLEIYKIVSLKGTNFKIFNVLNKTVMV
jgi:phosphoribosylcarboxyaminoimidazole (NCAIR) mutase